MQITLGTIDIPDAEATAAQELLDQHNQANGTAFTLQQFVRNRVKEIFQNWLRHRQRQQVDYNALTQSLKDATQEKREAAIEALKQALQS